MGTIGERRFGKKLREIYSVLHVLQWADKTGTKDGRETKQRIEGKNVIPCQILHTGMLDVTRIEIDFHAVDVFGPI